MCVCVYCSSCVVHSKKEGSLLASMVPWRTSNIHRTFTELFTEYLHGSEGSLLWRNVLWIFFIFFTLRHFFLLGTVYWNVLCGTNFFYFMAALTPPPPTFFYLLNIYSPQAIWDVDEFVSSSDLEKYIITLLAHQWMLCSEWVPSEWESKQLIKTSQ